MGKSTGDELMARTISQYFNQIGAKGEQRLVEDLIIESIRINGMEIFYVPRTLVKDDPVFGEDPLSKFEKVFPIEMYFDNPQDGWQGDRYIISKFGLEMRETANFIVSRRRFNETVRYDGFNMMPVTKLSTKEVRPMEGDLLYMPLTNDLFQINFAEHESVFYQLGYRYIWRIDVQKYDYSHETIKTGKPEIDRVQQFFQNADSASSDPLAENDDLLKEGAEVIDTTEKNVFGDPV
jgi:Virus neck protein